MKKTPLVSLLHTLLAVGWLAQAQAGLVIEENFSDADRTNQDPPRSLAWFASQGSASIGLANGVLTLASAGKGANAAVAHFPLVELTEGQTVHLSLKFKPTVVFGGTALYSMLVGIFDSNGSTLITDDGENPTPYGAFGYAVALNYNEHPKNNRPGGYYLRILKRVREEGLLITATKAYDIIANQQDNPKPVTFTTGKTYDFQFRLTKVSSIEFEMEATISGGDLAEPLTIRAVDVSSPLGRIDTIALTTFEEKQEGSGGFADTGFSDLRLEVDGQ